MFPLEGGGSRFDGARPSPFVTPASLLFGRRMRAGRTRRGPFFGRSPAGNRMLNAFGRVGHGARDASARVAADMSSDGLPPVSRVQERIDHRK